MNPKLSLITLLIAAAAGNTHGQGSIQWGNLFGATLRAPVYEVIPDHPSCRLTGNTPAGIPAGTQDYMGAPLLSGSGFTLAIFLGASEAEAQANNSDLGRAPFRTGAAAGFVFAQLATDPFRPPGTAGLHVQFRAWDNRGGTVTSWAQVLAAGGTIASGTSDIFTIGPLGGRDPFGIDHPTPLTDGARSFNLWLPASPGCPVPEPSTWSILATSAYLLLFCRRRPSA